MTRCFFIGCDTKSDTIFCQTHTPAKHGDVLEPISAKHEPPEPQSAKHRAGVKGGTNRARNLSPERRKEIAQIAAKARWAKTSLISEPI